MELSERCIQTLEKEGFQQIYEWNDVAQTLYPQHTHQGRVTLFITEGSMYLNIDNHTSELKPGARYDIPVNTPHTLRIGPDGCQFVVGEEIEGDFRTSKK